jgi:hypothetical protein
MEGPDGAAEASRALVGGADNASVTPRDIFRRLLGATDTLSATYDTLCPFHRPQRAMLAHNGLIYVADCGNNRVQALTAAGTLQHEWGCRGPSRDRLDVPLDLLVYRSEVYVADSGNERV